MPWGYAAAAVASYAGAQSSKRSADKQEQAARDAMAMQQNQFNMVRADSAASREIGTNALYKLADILGIDRAGPAAPNRDDFYHMPGEAKGKRDITDPFGWHGKANLEYTTSFSSAKKGKPLKKNQKGQPPSPIFDEAAYNDAMKAYSMDKEKFDKRPRGMAAVEFDPGYQFRLDQTNKSIDRYQSSGRVTGGRAIKEAQQYGQDFASKEFGNATARLFTLAGYGPVGVNQSASAGMNAANMGGQYSLVAGNAAANGIVGQNNAYQNFANNAMTYKTYNDWTNKNNQNTQTSNTGGGFSNNDDYRWSNDK